MWNKCKLKTSRLERETCLSPTENHNFALQSSTITKTRLGSALKIGLIELVKQTTF